MRVNYAIVFVSDMNRMLAASVRCVQEPRETFGVRIAQYADPDGLVISVSEDKRHG